MQLEGLGTLLSGSCVALQPRASVPWRRHHHCMTSLTRIVSGSSRHARHARTHTHTRSAAASAAFSAGSFILQTTCPTRSSQHSQGCNDVPTPAVFCRCPCVENPAVGNSIDRPEVTQENPVSLACLVRHVIAAGKTQCRLRRQQAAVLRIMSDN